MDIQIVHIGERIILVAIILQSVLLMMTNLFEYLYYMICVISDLPYNADSEMFGMEIRNDGELIY